MEAEQRPNVSVIDPIHPSIEWVKRILFSPFELERWFVIGFCAWLATLGGGGGGNAGNASKFKEINDIPAAKEWVGNNIHWIVPGVVAIIVVAVLVGMLLLYLSSRGRLMFLHCLRHNVAEIKRPWKMYADLARSLFLFRLVAGIIGMVGIIITAGIGIVVGIALSQGSGVLMVILMALLVPLTILLAMALGIIMKLTNDFVAPLMLMHQINCTQAWRLLLNLMDGNIGRFCLYLLFQLIIGIVIGTLVIFLTLVTCCVAACLFNIPYIGTVLFLPVLVFKQSYAFMYLRQYGPAYDIFYQPPAVEMPAPPHDEITGLTSEAEPESEPEETTE